MYVLHVFGQLYSALQEPHTGAKHNYLTDLNTCDLKNFEIFPELHAMQCNGMLMEDCSSMMAQCMGRDSVPVPASMYGSDVQSSPHKL